MDKMGKLIYGATSAGNLFFSRSNQMKLRRKQKIGKLRTEKNVIGT